MQISHFLLKREKVFELCNTVVNAGPMEPKMGWVGQVSHVRNSDEFEQTYNWSTFVVISTCTLERQIELKSIFAVKKYLSMRVVWKVILKSVHFFVSAKSTLEISQNQFRLLAHS